MSGRYNTSSASELSGRGVNSREFRHASTCVRINRAKLFEIQVHFAENILNVGFKTFNCGFPQTFKMWTMFRREFRADVLRSAKVLHGILALLSQQLPYFPFGTDEVRAMVTPYGVRNPSPPNKSAEGLMWRSRPFPS